MKAPLLGALALLAALSVAACDPQGGSATAPATPSSAAPPAASAALPPGHPPMGGAQVAPPTPAAAPIGYAVPSAWPKVDHPSRMRLATHSVPKAEGDAQDGELTVSVAGGNLDSNIQRWKGQFTGGPEPKRTDRSTADLTITMVELEGTYQGMAMPGAPAAGPMEGYAMIAAIVAAPGATESWFFKLTGPKKTVDAARAGFDELVSSFARK